MKFPSLRNVISDIATVIRRFPFEMLFAIMGTIAAICLTELSNTATLAETWCVRALMTANLGLLISLSTTLYAESKKISGKQMVIYKIITALLAAVLIFLINPYVNKADYTRFFLLSFGLHLLVAFAAFLAPGQIQGFWQFNKTLFLRFLTSALYSAVLFGGISAALGAMNFLFNFKFEWDTFMILFICITGLFSTLFFLAGVPKDTAALDNDLSYPKGLKIFTQYVLIPLATLYVIILLAYEIKILLQWNLPKGLVSNLILGYSVFGLLSLLLVFPISHQEENKWIKTFSRSFYFLMLPLIVLLFIAVGTRIFSYGITEFRYFLILLACWQLFIALYFLFSRKQNIKLIPISLCICTLLSIYGPQSAFSVSMYSQKRILLNVLKRNGMLKENKLISLGERKIAKKEGELAVEKIEYMINNYDLKVFQPYVKKDLELVSDSLSKLKSSNQRGSIDNYELKTKKLLWITSYLGLNKFVGYRYDWDKSTSALKTNYHITAESNGIVDVKGYDLMLNSNSYMNETKGQLMDGIRIIEDGTENLPGLKLNGEKAVFDLRVMMTTIMKDQAKLKPFAGSEEDPYDADYILPSNHLTFTQKTPHYTVTIKVTDIRFLIDHKKVVEEINSSDIIYLIKINK